MLERTKTPPTETVVLRFSGPASLREKAVAALREFGFENEDDTISWERVFPEHAPGRVLQGFRHRDGLTQTTLAERADIPRRHVSDMENGRRPIGKETAKRLAGVFCVDYRVFL
ncbi:MAG: helix-turn-helix transcriptional regulator [Desulfovibrionaceae bacterium]|nr:helix-turn-helix transcriptional regulator [Desulfovibrionaceae bacterium]